MAEKKDVAYLKCHGCGRFIALGQEVWDYTESIMDFMYSLNPPEEAPYCPKCRSVK